MADEISKGDKNNRRTAFGITVLNEEIYIFRFDDLTGRLLVETEVDDIGTPTIYNVTMTNADTEYSQALPAGTKAFEFQCRTDFDVRFAFATGKVATPTAPYMTLKSRHVYFKDRINLTSKTLYIACATAAQVIEIICWT